MDFLSQWLGLVIILLLLFFPLIRKLLVDWGERRKRHMPSSLLEPPKAPQKPTRRALAAAPVKKVGNHQFKFQSTVERLKRQSQITARTLDVHIEPAFTEKPKRKKRRKLALRSLVIYSEIYEKRSPEHF